MIYIYIYVYINIFQRGYVSEFNYVINDPSMTLELFSLERQWFSLTLNYELLVQQPIVTQTLTCNHTVNYFFSFNYVERLLNKIYELINYLSDYGQL